MTPADQPLRLRVSSPADEADRAVLLRLAVPTTGDAVYEAWAIRGDGPPVPLGSFKVGNARTAYFEADGAPGANGVILALTLEPGPGATTPTLPIVSKGVASAPS